MRKRTVTYREHYVSNHYCNRQAHLPSLRFRACDGKIVGVHTAFINNQEINQTGLQEKEAGFLKEKLWNHHKIPMSLSKLS